MTPASLPFNHDAERAVLGSILLDREAIIPIAPWLHAEHFDSAKHRAVYQAMHTLYTKRIPPDITLVGDELRRADHLDTVGGIPLLIDLSNAVATAYHIEYYARIVERTAVQRQVIESSGRIVRIATSSEHETVDELIAAVNLEMGRATVRPGLGRVWHISEAVDKVYKRIEQGSVPSIPTGFTTYDKKFGGLYRGALHTIGGATGIGKTALVGQIAQNVARSGCKVLFFSLEMPDEEIAERQIAGASGVDVSSIHRNTLADDEASLSKVIGAMADVASLPIYGCDDASVTMAEVTEITARTAYEVGGIGVVIFDYMQLANVSGADSRYVAMGEISKSLKQIAMQQRCAVLGLSQLAGSLDERQDKRPVIRDLYESRKLGHDSDVILMLYRDDYYNLNSDAKGIAELNVLKNRHGPQGQALLRFDAPTNRFQNLEQWRSPEGY